MNVEKRIALEKRIVTHLVRELKAAGYLPTQVWDSEEYQKATNETETLDAVFSVDESTIHFDGGNGATNDHGHGVLIILGNGCDCISDYHVGDPAFKAVVDRVTDWTRQFDGQC